MTMQCLTIAVVLFTLMTNSITARPVSQWKRLYSPSYDFYDNGNVVNFQDNAGFQNVHPSQNQIHYMSKNVKVPQHQVSGVLDSWLVKKLLSVFDKIHWKDGFTCDACKVLVSAVKIVVKLGLAPQEITNVATVICEKFDIEDDKICKSVVLEFQTEFVAVINTVPLSAGEICGVTFGSTCGTPSTVNWNITLPMDPKPPLKPIPTPKADAAKLRVLQISDIHFDPLYQPASNAVCDEPLCCRATSGSVGNKTAEAGKWGDYRNCDTPLWTLENLFQHLATQKFDYVLWTGDLPPHDIWEQTELSQLVLLKNLTDMLLKYFPKTPIFPALGNHESAPVNSFPPPFVTGTNSIAWLYDALATNWSHWLPQDTIKNIKYGAYYTVLLKPGFRIVSINTNYCNNMNWWLLLNMTDPAEDLQWLIDTLLYAEKHNEKVHIIGHIPPGVDDCLKVWSSNYYKIINRFESTVIAQYFAHTHKDHFEIFYDEVNKTRPVSIAYIGPSVTPYSYINPGYRVYTIDGFYENSSFTVLDHETHILNLTDINLKNSQPVWQEEYSAKSTYQMKSLLPNDWDNLVQQMAKNDTVFQTYYRYYFKSNPQSTKCDAACKKTMLCALKSGKSYDPKLC